MSDHKPAEPDIAAPDARAKMIADIREMLTWLEANPDVPVPSWFGLDVHLSKSVLGDDPLATSPRRMAKMLARGGRVEKWGGGTIASFYMTRYFGKHARITASFETKDTCEAKVVGQREVTEHRYTDEERAKELEAELEKLSERVVVGTEPIVEYDCKPLLAQT